MDVKELRTKKEADLKKMLLEHRKEQLNLRFQLANGSLEKVSRIKIVRRTIARLKTLLKEKTN